MQHQGLRKEGKMGIPEKGQESSSVQHEASEEGKYLVRLTVAQCLELTDYQRDQIIEEQDKEGWIFVHAAENFGNEGSGVWMDLEGQEQHGPVGFGPEAT
jgi:hypothetical protein